MTYGDSIVAAGGLEAGTVGRRSGPWGAWVRRGDRARHRGVLGASGEISTQGGHRW